MSPYQAVDECFFAFFFSAEILDLLRPKKLRNTYILVYILLLVCMNVFFSHIDVFFSSGSGYFSCSRLRGTQGARPNTPAQVWALAEVRGTCSGVSKSQVTTGRHSEIQDLRYHISRRTFFNLYVGLHGPGWLYMLGMPARGYLRL